MEKLANISDALATVQVTSIVNLGGQVPLD